MRQFLESWMLDLKFGARSLRRTPGFALVAIGTLAIAFGVTTGMFTVVNAMLIQPLPYAHPDRLLFVSGTAPGSDLPPDLGVSSEFFIHYRERATLLEDVALIDSFTSTLRVRDRVERVRMSMPTYTLFTTLGATPILGRLPVATDESRTALISYALWQNWFGGDPNVIGQSHSMSGDNRTIIGVIGPEFAFPTEGTLLWIPTDVPLADIRLGDFGSPMVVRMKPGTTADAVARELTTLAKELPSRFGGSPAYARVMSQYQAVTRPLADQVVGAAARPVWVLFGGAAIVLLIACANVANLFLVRSEGRHREMAVRQAIGAGRAQLLRVQFAEVLIVSTIAATLAVLFARLTLPLVVSMSPDVPRLREVAVTLETVFFAAGLAIAAGFACGVLPAIRATSPQLYRLREGGRGMTRGRHWTRNGLVIAQTALALVLLISAALLLRSHSMLSHVNPGYDTRDIFTFQIAPEQPALTDGPSHARFSLNFMDRLRALPGVQSVGLIENVPLDEGTAIARFRTEATAGQSGVPINVTFAGADYYRTMSIKVLAGRGFTREDAVSSLGNVVISKSAAALLWPGGDPIGRRLQREGLTTWETVVGVVDDVMQRDFREPAQALVYLPMTGQLPTQWRLRSPAYVVKTTRATTIGADIRTLAREIAPEAPMYRAFTMAGLAERSMVDLSFTMMTLGLVAAMAVILGAIGLYGVLSYVVAERTREIGVRLALGAQPGGVRLMVVLQGAQVVALGVLVGLVGAWAATQQLGSLLFGVQPLDALTFVGTSVAMLLVGMMASYLPARRASNVDPIQSLRD